MGTNMNWRWKTFFIIITLLIYLSLYYVSIKYLSDLYWLEWTRRHRYVWTWVFAIGFILGNRIFISFSITVGNLAGVIIGQHLGDRIQAYTISQIVPGMDAETVYHLHDHPGIEIWLCTLFFFVVIGVIAEKLWRRKVHV